MTHPRHRTVAPAALAALLLLSCTVLNEPGPYTKPTPLDTAAEPGDEVDPYEVVIGPYDVTVNWTAYGVPHIIAADEGSLGYGMGYAFARDHVCTLIDQVVMVNSERARYHGAGPGNIHVDNDLGWLALGVKRQAEAGWPDVDPRIQARIVGYAAGVNRYVEEQGEALPDARCASAPWMREINHIDLLAYFLAFGLNGSAGNFVDAIGTATPPGAGGPPPPPVDRTLGAVLHPKMGSNGWAIGGEMSENGQGMLLSNTHFPAIGERQWHESHLTIPGELDVYGASLMGVPVINIGFNRDVAWTHTVSGAPRFVVYLLTLEPGQPTRYNSRGTIKDMEEYAFSVQVLGEDGGLSTVTRTLYKSDFGWVMNAPVVGWTPLNAFALMDANENNLAMLPTWFAMNRATSLEAFQAAHRDHLGIPWVHTMAASKEGEAWYIDSSAVPNWSPATAAAYEAFRDTQVLAGLFADYGVYVADAADPTFDWTVEPGARARGLIPYEAMPQQVRGDFVFNSNDNHWLSNPAAPLAGYNYLYGPEASARTPRTRMNALYLTERGAGSAVGEDDRLSLDELERAALGGRGMLAELLRADVAERCQTFTAPVRVTYEGTAQDVDLAPACAAVGAWGGTARLDDPGAAIWREIVASGVYDYAEGFRSGLLFSQEFDPADPVGSPADLATGAAADAALAEAMALGTLRLQSAGAAPDAPLRGLQHMPKNGEKLPFPGGTDVEGTIQIATYSDGSGTLLADEGRSSVINNGSDLTTEGYTINYGNSWVMAMRYTPEGPDARAVLTYSQSEVPGTAHNADQTAIYGEERLRPILFEQDAILADPERLELRLQHD